MKTTSMRTFLICGALLSVAGCGELGETKLTVKGPGQVRSNPAGIHCQAAAGDCSAELGESYILSAEPNAGAHFDHWEGDVLCTEGARATVVISRAPRHVVSCTAVFADGEAASATTTQ